ncbi:hypothetical protein [Dyella monticola]|nr:hypothetical protein [Dyella monticola]
MHLRINAISRYLWTLPVIVFMIAVAVHIDLPGLYMDAVNPDFLAAQKLHHHLHNPTAGLPSKLFPILGNLYHGVQNFYVDLPVLTIFGFDVGPLRIAQALFGAGLLAAFFVAAQRLSKSTALAMAAALGLATEIAFTASFRTQFYIVMGGATWLAVSLMLALPLQSDTPLSRHRLFWSGFFSGLAGYGYFVLLFFVPGMFALIALRPKSNLRDTVRWAIGLAVGFAPFAVGYVSLALKLHGIGATVAFIRGLLGALHPFESGGTNGGNLLYAWRMAMLAITNNGNDAMVFGHALPSAWGVVKFYVFAACLLVLSVWCLGSLVLRRQAPPATLLGLLPLSYLLVASLFGHRLWAHHFCVLVPFVYLLPLALLTSVLKMQTRKPFETALMGLASIAWLIGNLTQQVAFHESLAHSGGEGLSTSALTQLAVEARNAPSTSAYIFPEWGFFTSFCLLTENKVRYVIDASPETLLDLKRDGYSDLRLVYWQPTERAHYMQVLQQAGTKTITERTFTTLDGRAVFYWLEGRTTQPSLPH